MGNAIIYAYGFDGDPEAVTAEVAAIGPTDFDVVIPAFLHVHEDGSLYLNNTAVGQLWAGLSDAIAQLKTGFPTHKSVIVSLGGWGNSSDFINLYKNGEAAMGGLLDFLRDFNLDGIDLDLEEVYSDATEQALVWLIGEYKTAVPAGIVTAPPYTFSDWWGGLLKKTAGQFSWWNVQFYEGGSNVPPDQYQSTFDEWAQVVKAAGIADPAAFIAPGCNGSDDASFDPGTMKTALAGLNPHVDSGFVWEYQGLHAPVGAWGEAIATATG